MKPKRMLVVVLLVLAVVTVYAQVVIYLPHTMSFMLDGTSYLASIKREAVTSGHVWDTSKPLPLSFAKAEQVARAELRKMVRDEPGWYVQRFQLCRLGHTEQWYYSVEFMDSKKHEEPTTGVFVFVDASGKAGSIKEGRLE